MCHINNSKLVIIITEHNVWYCVAEEVGRGNQKVGIAQLKLKLCMFEGICDSLPNDQMIFHCCK